MVEAAPGSPLAADALAGQVAIVTGGGTGIGRATAREMVAAGARVAICGRRTEPIEAVRDEVGDDACLAVPCDVREPEQVAGFLDAVATRYDKLAVRYEATVHIIAINEWLHSLRDTL